MNTRGYLSSRTLIAAAALGSLTWAVSVSCAYHQTLDESDIMAAYNLANDAGFRRFMADYERTFPPTTGIHISRIAIRTPFANLVQLRHDQGGRITEVNFRDDYLAHPDTSFTAILTVESPVAKPPDGLDNPNSAFWKSFKFELSQDDPVSPRSLSAGTLLMSSYKPITKTYSDSLAGAELYLRFDVQDVPSKTTHLKATASDGSALTADFDLEQLK